MAYILTSIQSKQAGRRYQYGSNYHAILARRKARSEDVRKKSKWWKERPVLTKNDKRMLYSNPFDGKPHVLGQLSTTGSNENFIVRRISSDTLFTTSAAVATAPLPTQQLRIQQQLMNYEI